MQLLLPNAFIEGIFLTLICLLMLFSTKNSMYKIQHTNRSSRFSRASSSSSCALQSFRSSFILYIIPFRLTIFPRIIRLSIPATVEPNKTTRVLECSMPSQLNNDFCIEKRYIIKRKCRLLNSGNTHRIKRVLKFKDSPFIIT